MTQKSSRVSTQQSGAYTVATGPVTNAFGGQTKKVRLYATSACAYKIGDGTQTAAFDNTSVFLPAQWVEYVTVNPGQKIAAIRSTTNGLLTATDGTLFVTELTD